MGNLISNSEYGVFSESLYDKSFSTSTPTHGHFELTFRCPLACDFCYCSCYISDAHVARELNTDQVIRILEEAAQMGCLWITFSGGDPFLRKDFITIYKHAQSLGLIVSVFCSGLIFTQEWRELFKSYPPFKLEFPLYGSSAAVHEAVSGIKGSFSKIITNLKRMQEDGISVRVKTKVTKKNLADVQSLRNFLEDEFQLEFRSNYFLYPKLNGDSEHLSERLSKEEIVALEKEISFEKCDSKTEILSEDLGEASVSTKLFRCAAGVNSFYVNPYGELNFCTYVRQSSYDLKQGSLKEGMAKLRRELLQLEYPKGSACGTCSIQGSCQNCPGHAYLETGTLEGKSDYLCEVNKALSGAIE